MNHPDLFSQPPLPSFHNTNGLAGNELRESELKACTQDADVLDVFRKLPGVYLSPEQVKDRFLPDNYRSVPLTSIRRAMTNLTKKGLIVKTNLKVMGQYGAMVSTWRLNK